MKQVIPLNQHMPKRKFNYWHQISKEIAYVFYLEDSDTLIVTNNRAFSMGVYIGEL